MIRFASAEGVCAMHDRSRAQASPGWEPGRKEVKVRRTATAQRL